MMFPLMTSYCELGDYLVYITMTHPVIGYVSRMISQFVSDLALHIVPHGYASYVMFLLPTSRA